MIYAKKGDLLKVLHSTIDMLFVESREGLKFHIRKENVTGNLDAEIKPKENLPPPPPPPPKFKVFDDIPPTSAPVIKKTKKSQKNTNQLGLF